MNETTRDDDAALRLWLALKDPALPCHQCGAVNQKRFGDECWMCHTTLNWRQSLICKKCRRLHARPTAFCLDCRGPLEVLRECPGCRMLLGVSMAFCPECGREQRPPAGEAAIAEASIKCANCGEKTDAAKFCSHCGAALA